MKESAYKNYLLNVLLVVLAFNFVDRLAMGLILQDVKADLHLTDTQLGLLTGVAFALFYSVAGIPIARLADRGNRILIIATTLALWSVMVGLCGAAMSFTQLLLIRIGVGVGEAGCVPPANSLIAEHFTRAERPRAMARFLMGGPLACVLGYFVAGWLNELYGWRTTFVLLGLPGVALALLVKFTLREPRLARPSPPSAADSTSHLGAQPSLRVVLTTLGRNRTFLHLLLSYCVFLFFSYGVANWQPAYFVRSFGLKTGEIGIWLAVIWGGGGSLGTYLGGELASRWAAGRERRQLLGMAVIYLIAGLAAVGIYIAPNYHVAFAMLLLVAVGVCMTSGPMFAIIQTLVPESMRAMSVAVVYMAANLIGMGLGPLIVGALSDAFGPWAHDESLRYALLVTVPGYWWCGWHLWRGSRTVDRDLDGVGI